MKDDGITRCNAKHEAGFGQGHGTEIAEHCQTICGETEAGPEYYLGGEDPAGAHDVQIDGGDQRYRHRGCEQRSHYHGRGRVFERQLVEDSPRTPAEKRHQDAGIEYEYKGHKIALCQTLIVYGSPLNSFQAWKHSGLERLR